MRVALVLPRFAVGGVLTYASELRSALPADVDVRLISLFSILGDVPASEVPEQAIMLGLPSEAIQQPHLHTASLRKLFRDEGIDVVHTNHIYCDSIAIRAAEVDGRIGVIRTVHGIAQSLRHNPLCKSRLVTDWPDEEIDEQLGMGRRCYMNTTVSDATASKLLRYGFRPDRLQVIANGIECSRLSPTLREDAYCKVRAEFDIDNSAMVIGFIGRMEPTKGATLLPNILGPIDQKIVVVVIGDGPQQYEVQTRLVSQLPRSRLRFLGAQRDARRIMCCFDLLLLPSWEEGLPYVALEAMALGIPVIASDAGGLPELIKHEVTGMLFARGDVSMASECLRRLLQDRALQYRLSRSAREHVLSLHSASTMADRMYKLYQGALGSRR